MSEQKTILCIGDSIVEGYPFGHDASWVIHAERTRSRDGRDELWVNAGISGQTTGEIRNRMERTLERWAPDLVILSCGTNDFIFLEGEAGGSASAWANIEAMAEAALGFGAKVIVTAPPLTIGPMASRRWSDGTDYDAVNRKLRELRRRILAWCEKNDGRAETVGGQTRVMFWDVQGAFEQWCSAPEDWFVDGLHPTRRGYEEMAAFLCEKLPLMNF